MAVLQSSHRHILTDGDLVLRPLTDEHLPLLYKWNGDPEVVYWSDDGNDDFFDEETVRAIYSHVSKNALHFLIQWKGRPIGDCWLQRMNIPQVLERYPPNTDIRRIDMEIGEKDCWEKGLGTKAFARLVQFAFEEQGVDVLYNVCSDYNVRSQRMQEKIGFVRVQEEPNEEGNRAKYEYHYCLTCGEYFIKKSKR